jgi:hypothetical protein
MTEWDEKFELPTTFQGIRAVKIRWQQYQTIAEGNKELMLKCDELGSSGLFLKKDRSNVRYLLAVPLDQGLGTSCVYSNLTSEMDMEYENVPLTLNLLSFQVFVNGIPATSLITEDAPLDIELILYKYRENTI